MSRPNPRARSRRFELRLPIAKAISSTLMLAITCGASAQELPRIELPYRVKYENSPDLPNGIAFYMMLLTLDDMHAQSGGVDSGLWVEEELQLNSVDSSNLVSQALRALYLMKNDIATQLAGHSCQFAGAEVSKSSKYAALQQTYDIEKAIYDHYYDQFKASFDSDTGEKLQRWIDTQKLHAGHFEIDFEEADRRTGQDSTGMLSILCQGAYRRSGSPDALL